MYRKRTSMTPDMRLQMVGNLMFAIVTDPVGAADPV
jgi:hypothetical protein